MDHGSLWEGLGKSLMNTLAVALQGHSPQGAWPPLQFGIRKPTQVWKQARDHDFSLGPLPLGSELFT